MSSASAVGEDSSPARRPSRYESQKRRDWQTFTRYLGSHRPPLQLRRCSGAHVLEFLRYLDRFGKTRVHAPPCPAYGGGGGRAAEACQCPLRQAWGSLDALVGRLRAAFDERHGARGSGATATTTTRPQHESGGGDGASSNPFAARAVRLFLRDVRDAQARARGISYSRKKKKRNKHQGGSGSANGGATTSMDGHHSAGAAVGCVCPRGNVPAAATPPAPDPSQPYLAGVPFECCDYGSVFGGPTANGGGGAAGFYLPLLFNTFG